MSCAALARQRIVIPFHRASSCRTRIRRAERRRFARYDVGLLVLLPGGIGRTVNLSETGVLIETDQAFRLMEPIEFDLVLEELDPERPYWMRCQGSIVRVDPATSGWRIAIDIDRYTLPSPGD